GRPGGEELAEVAGGDDLDAEGADQLDGAAVDLGDVRVVAPGRVLHGDPASAPQERREPALERLPAVVGEELVVAPRERALLDGVDEHLDGAVVGRDPDEPAAGEEPVAGSDHLARVGVAAAEVEQQPAVHARAPHRLSDLAQPVSVDDPHLSVVSGTSPVTMWHAATWSCLTGARAGTISWHSARAKGQRGANEQALGFPSGSSLRLRS